MRDVVVAGGNGGVGWSAKIVRIVLKIFRGNKKHSHDFRQNNTLSFYTTLLCYFRGSVFFVSRNCATTTTTTHRRTSTAALLTRIPRHYSSASLAHSFSIAYKHTHTLSLDLPPTFTPPLRDRHYTI